MSGTFFGLDLALRALLSQQTALDVTNHNIANANTDGFSRQTASLVTTTPYTMPAMNRANGPGQLGTGVQVGSIDRSRDVFLDVQYRTELGTLHQAQVTQDALEQVEAAINDPSDSGMSKLFSEFFRTWHELANDPSDVAVRATVVQQAIALANEFNRVARQLGSIQQNLNDQVEVRVDLINSLTSQITALNRQIVQIEGTGQHANDFRDRRDLMVDQLAQLVQVVSTENADGSINLTVGGHALVSGNTAETLTVTPTGTGGMWEVRFASDNSLVAAGNGEVSGLVNARDQNVPTYLSKLDTIAASLVNAVNGLHLTGYGLDGATGRAFFTGTDAATIAVDPAIAADPSKIGAASAAGQVGDNAVALAIAQLRTTMSPTTENDYAALVAGLGVDARAAGNLAENQGALVQIIDRRRQAISGVSLDEEAVQALRYQRAYEAAARLITANDQLLDKLINATGIVGR